MSHDPEHPLSIAVIGMTGRFPGAGDVDTFWENLRGGVESISFFSPEEMRRAGVSSSEFEAPDYVPARGVAAGLDLFDAAFFGYTPAEAEIMDPQHRVFLECAWAALEHGGIDPERYEGLIGVFAGTSISSYLINNLISVVGSIGPGSIQVALANDKDHVPTRVSYKLDLRGPSVNVQTACSTSLVAVHLACQSLLNGECDVAMAGGASVTVPIDAGYRYEVGSIVSADGHCRAFDADSGGVVGGSGAAIVVLKRLEDALADGDTVHAVIRGSAINNDGAAKVGYTAPSVEGQADVIAQAQAIAGVSPDTVTYIEAHGTATQLGDPIEVAALTRAFRTGTERSGFCAIGSVKTNIGHLDAAAGVAGLVKVVQSLRHRELPPSLHFKAPNPELALDSSPFYVNSELAEWSSEGSPRRAGVSSFGIGGTNAHVILEEAPEPSPSGRSRDWQLLVMSARTGSALESVIEELADHLRREPELALPDVAHTLQSGRKRFAHRSTLVVRAGDDAAAALRTLKPRERGVGTEATDRPVVFMFPGQGSQYVDMGRDLYTSEPTFRRHVDACSEILRPLIGEDLRDVLYPGEAEVEAARERLTDTRLTQPALFTIQYALAQLWMEWGIRPRAMIGHSVGEYVAACLAGVFSLEDALALIAARGRMISDLPGGSMMAVPLPQEEITPYLGDGVGLAAVNQVDLCVVSGAHDAIGRLEARLASDGLEGRRLHTSHAFHSRMMDPVLAPFEAKVAEVSLRPPAIPFVSGVTGGWITDEDATDAAYWARHVREPVRFAAGVGELLKDPQWVLLEVGPGQTLSTLSRRHPDRTEETPIVASMRHPRADRADQACLLDALGALWEVGASVDWSGFQRHESRRKVPLPTYPFQRQRYWIEPRSDRERIRAAGQGKLPDISDWFYLPSWKTSIPPSTLEGDEQDACWLLLGGEVELVSRLGERLGGTDRQFVTVDAGEAYGRVSDRRYTIDPADPAHWVALLRELRARGLLPDVVVHGWCAAPGPDMDGRAHDILSGELDRGFYSLLFLGRALEEEVTEPVRLGVVTAHAHDLPGSPPVRPLRSVALGPCKVLPQELSNVTVVNADVDPGEVHRWGAPELDRLLADIRAGSPDAVVAYRGRHRLVETFEPARVEDGRAGSLRTGGVYLVIGGLGGVGLEVARQVYETAGAKLVLTTRRQVPSRDLRQNWQERPGADALNRAVAQLQELEERGADILVVQADVTDPLALEAVFDQASAAFGDVDGVFFAAGAEKDPTPVADADRAACDAQFEPRVLGLLALADVTRGRALDFCMVQSSLASVLGAVGFAAYTAAHLFMDAFVARQNGEAGCKWICVDWDNWVTWKDADTAVEEVAELAMTRDEGARAFRRVLSMPSVSRLVVSTGDLASRIERWINPEAAAEDAPSRAGAAGRTRYPRPDTGKPYVAPSTDAELALAEIWGDVLGIDEVGVDDNFFELGGDSVLSIQVIAKARRAELHITTKQMFEQPTIAELALASSAAAAPVTEQGVVSGEAVLTPIQRWFFEQEVPRRHHFNMPRLLEAENIDRGRLERAVAHLVAHHDALRLRYTEEDGTWRQTHAAPGSDVEVAEVDLSSVPAGRLPGALDASAAEFQAGLDLSAGPLLRAVLYRTAPGTPERVLLVAHHLVVDAVSWRILVEDLDLVYGQLTRGELPRLPAKTTSFQAWGERLSQYARSQAVQEEAEFWMRRSRGGDAPPLPVELQRGPNTIASARSVSASLDPEDTRALLQEVPRVYSARMHEILLAALTSALAEWTACGSVRIALEGHGREEVIDDVDLSRTVGWFTTLFPTRFDLDDPHDPTSVLRAVKERYREIPHGGLGYGLLRYMGTNATVAAALREDPQPEVSFLYLGNVDQRGEESGSFRVLGDPAGPACDADFQRPHVLDVMCRVADGELVVDVGYSANLHSRETVEDVVGAILETLRSLVAGSVGGKVQALAPSDFPAAALSQSALDALIARIDEQE